MAMICGAGDFVEFNGQLVDKAWRDTNYPDAVGWKGYKTLPDYQVVPSANKDKSPCQWWGYNFGLPNAINKAKIEFTLWTNVGYTANSPLFWRCGINEQKIQINLQVQMGGYTDGVTTGNVGLRTLEIPQCVNPMVWFHFLNGRYNSNIQGFLRGIKVWYN